MGEYEQYPLHAGRYDKEKYAEHYANILRENGKVVEVKPRIVYDVWVISQGKKKK